MSSHWNFLLDSRDSQAAKFDAAKADAVNALATLLASGNACKALREAHAHKLVQRAAKLLVGLIVIDGIIQNESLLQLAEEGPDV